MKYIIEIRPTKVPRTWQLINSFTYGEITVPRGFLFDGASVPVGLRWIFPHGGAKMAAALVHDYCYRTACVSRKEADKLFHDLMLENGVSKWRAKAMYAGVRSCGFVSWRNRRKEDD